MAGDKPAGGVSPEPVAPPPMRVGVVTLLHGKLQPTAPVAVSPAERPAPSVVPAQPPRPVFPLWPFLLADALLIGAALQLVALGSGAWARMSALLLVVAGAGIALLPFWLNRRKETPTSSSTAASPRRLPVRLS